MRTVVVRGGAAGFAQEIVAGPHRLVADEPAAAGGTDTGPSPYDLLLAALGAWTSMTLALYARGKGWPLEGVTVRLAHSRIHASDCAECETREGMLDRIEREIALAGPLTAAQRARLLEMADRCPVHRTLTSEIDIRSRLVWRRSRGGPDPMPSLRYGQPAPDFSLPATTGGSIALADFKGKADVVLVFYCYDWGNIWTPELADLGQVGPGVRERGAELLAISGDSPPCHAAFAKARSVPFPLLSDLHRVAIRAYGVLDEDRNVAYRSTFVVDRDGVLRWGQAGDRQMVRDGREILRVLDVIRGLRSPRPGGSG